MRIVHRARYAAVKASAALKNARSIHAELENIAMNLVGNASLDASKALKVPRVSVAMRSIVT